MGPPAPFARRPNLPKMNKSAIVATAALGIAAAASAGFWVGANRPLGDRDAATAPASTAAGAAAPAQSGANGAPTTVEATKVAVMAMPQSITAVGSLRSDESITVRPEVAGRISAILFKEGQQVGKGMTLLRLDPAINQAEVQQARANLKLAQTKYDRASNCRSAISFRARRRTRRRTTCALRRRRSRSSRRGSRKPKSARRSRE
jgi:membrane fusion protein (multidrug efflux system)